LAGDRDVYKSQRSGRSLAPLEKTRDFGMTPKVMGTESKLREEICCVIPRVAAFQAKRSISRIH
jgi:hypothetical protein